MKICILGDLHFGCRNDSLYFHDYFRKFFELELIPYLIDNEIDTIIQLGDLFDRRKHINYQTLDLARKYFFDVLLKENIKLITLLGNHDIFLKDSLAINAPEMLLGSYNNITIIKKPITLSFNNIDVDIIPWVCDENYNEVLDKIKNSDSRICFGHFELDGFEMDRGNVFSGGRLTKQDLLGYTRAYTGHFHHCSTDGHITYMGTPYELTWADWSDPRGFHILDIETGELQFIKNPHNMFHKVVYDDNEQNEEYWLNYNFDQHKNTFVKLIVLNKTNPHIYDKIYDQFNNIVADLGILEDFTEEFQDEINVDQAEDILTILNKWIDKSETNNSINTDKMKLLMREIYIESLNKEKYNGNF